MNIPRILIAAPSSGSGKTVISCGLMAAFCRQQKNVVSCKCGPDYIDPMFHREVLGIDSQNLDLFFCEKEQLTGIFAEHAKNADLAVVEGVMGYYDGMGLDTAKASSYDVAAALQIPDWTNRKDVEIPQTDSAAYERIPSFSFRPVLTLLHLFHYLYCPSSGIHDRGSSLLASKTYRPPLLSD